MNQQFFNDIAAALGGTFIPAKWHSEEPASDDRGYIFFGDPTDWRTPSIFLVIGGWRREGKLTVHTNHFTRYLEGDCVRGMRNKLPYSFEAVMSVSKGAAACAKDIKRRVVDPMMAAHPTAIKDIEAANAVEADRMAWCASIGLQAGRDNGYTPGGLARIEYVHEDSVRMNLTGISRAQCEAVIKTLREGL